MLEIKKLMISLIELNKSLLKSLDRSEKKCCFVSEEPKPPEPPNPPQVMAHGFAYTRAENNTSGTLPLRIAGPLHDVELVSDGLVVATAGIYLIQYSVSVTVRDELLSPARFQIMINDLINVDSSVTETISSQQLMSSQLFSLLNSDSVKLVAEIPQGMNYSLVSLQVVQIG